MLISELILHVPLGFCMIVPYVMDLAFYVSAFIHFLREIIILRSHTSDADER